MDSISNVISKRADDLFKSPAYPSLPADYTEQFPDVIIDLEAVPNNTIIENIMETDDNILFQEDAPTSLPKMPPASAEDKIAALKTIIHSMHDQLDIMLKFINNNETILPNIKK